jgi:hypothetical protein
MNSQIQVKITYQPQGKTNDSRAPKSGEIIKWLRKNHGWIRPRSGKIKLDEFESRETSWDRR